MPARRHAARFVVFAALGCWLLAASALVTMPMWLVPATLQSMAVLLVGALGSLAVGVASVASYLAQGAAGLPFFAGGSGGPAVLMGPTAGYLLGFIAAAWLAGFVEWERVLDAGFLVFVPAMVVKTALALALLRAVRR